PVTIQYATCNSIRLTPYGTRGEFPRVPIFVVNEWEAPRFPPEPSVQRVRWTPAAPMERVRWRIPDISVRCGCSSRRRFARRLPGPVRLSPSSQPGRGESPRLCAWNGEWGG